MRIAVLGAGLQGVCIALELAARGCAVVLYDRAQEALTGASLRNEGKIHLGYVYQKDKSLRTAQLMAKGGLSFCPLLRRWLGGDVDTLTRSAPFHYLLHKQSQLSVEESSNFMHRVHEFCLQTSPAGADYFGANLSPPLEVTNLEREGISGQHVAAAFLSDEVAIDPAQLAATMRRRVRDDSRIETRFGHVVATVNRGPDRVGVASAHAGQTCRDAFDHVVNALWDGRVQIDEAFGVAPARPFLFRYKEFISLESPAASSLPSATIVLGAFGDVVNYGGGRAYLSWYPAGLRATTREAAPPNETEVLASRDANQVKRAIHTALTEFCPSLGQVNADDLLSSKLGGGWIFGWGETDIVDKGSELHERFDVGPNGFGRYISVDTGKYTLAPLFAMRTAEMIAPK